MTDLRLVTAAHTKTSTAISDSNDLARDLLERSKQIDRYRCRKKLEVPNKHKLDAQDLVNILAYFKVHTCKTLNDIIEGLELTVKKSDLSKFIRANALRIYRQKSRLYLFEHQRITSFIWVSHHEYWTLDN